MLTTHYTGQSASQNRRLWLIGGSLLNCFLGYINERRQRVVVRGASSSFLNVMTSRAPQGRVLGLLLFLLYTNDLQNSIAHSDNLVMLCKFKSLSLFISLEIHSLYGQEHRKIAICMTKCRAGFATEHSSNVC